MAKQFLFVPDPSFGHINPTLPLVRELTRRGHRVSYATSPHFAAAVEAVGATAVVLPWDEPPRPSSPDVTAEDMADMQDHVLADTRDSFPILEAHCEKHRPDAVCFDMVSFAGRVLAEKGDWASVATMPTYAGNEKFSLTEVFVSDSFEYNHPRLIELDRKMRDFAAEHGVKINPNPLAEVLAPLNIVFIPKAFHIAGKTFDDRFRFVGPSERPEEDAASWQPPSSGAPVVFVSLGTGFNDLPDFFRRCMKAFADDRWHVVMATGERLDEALLGSIPPNVEVAPDFLQQAVLRHAKVFVSHLGMGSAMDALYFGVPLVGSRGCRSPASPVTASRSWRWASALTSTSSRPKRWPGPSNGSPAAPRSGRAWRRCAG